MRDPLRRDGEEPLRPGTPYEREEVAKAKGNEGSNQRRWIENNDVIGGSMSSKRYVVALSGDLEDSVLFAVGDEAVAITPESHIRPKAPSEAVSTEGGLK